MKMRLAAVLAVGLCFSGGVAQGDGPAELPMEAKVTGPAVGHVLNVYLNFAHILLLDEPVATIAVGNSGIVEATLSDDQTVILTAQAPGTTNLIILDGDGDELSNTMVRVVERGDLLTTVYRGSARYTYACADRCTPVISIGDEAGFFDSSVSQIQARQEQAGEGQ
ncbi:pilus assembly protein N-terminal domain-containing protein [Pelagibacterium sp. H642]|uniref:pilus assembly protein N-terminal domain-containing protein n=1 Tax=Pelagibacterium sp. H642 TaxID=1881069 RepID=UPI0028155BEC|nr:pilus assembly protein N-terminal domain-containing protein [Pelagibacterium sp. H642]WMT92872.1 pilus assembly protein N-terminal domain-containing protein [Pelagibacterium sp. H642]